MNSQIIAVATGNFHSLLLLESGQIYSWGENSSGQLGDGTTLDRTGLNLISGIPGKVLHITGGANHSLALLDSGKVYCWGGNRFGQLGDGTKRESTRPHLTKALPGLVVAIAAGNYHSLALLESGKVCCWGWNRNGQLGDGTTQDRHQPHLLETIPGKVIAIAAGDYHSLALLESGEVYCWGDNTYGQLGDGTKQECPRPQIIKTIPGKVISIASGYYHSLALLGSGEVYGWGRNKSGQLGIKTQQNQPRPQLIWAIQGKVVGIAAGDLHSLLLLKNGEVCGCGSNAVGQLDNSKHEYVRCPKIISKVDKRILLSPFGKGGKVVGYTEIEIKFRELLGQELHL